MSSSSKSEPWWITVITVIGGGVWLLLNSLDVISGCVDCASEHNHEPAAHESTHETPAAHPTASGHTSGATHGGRPPE